MSESIFFQAPATIRKYETMRDRTVRITVETDRELDSAEAAALHLMLLISGTFGFVASTTSTDELDTLEIPEEVLEVNQKSFAERARAVAFLKWKHSGEKDTFDNYWSRYKEEILKAMKKGLPPLRKEHDEIF